MMLLDAKFKIGDRVFLETDAEQETRIVTGYTVRANGITYMLSCGTAESYHFDFEINATKDVVKATSN